LLRGLVFGLLLLAALGLYVWMLLRGSLPRLEGEVAIPGLTAPVSIERDAEGVATIRGGHRIDVARGLGYAHGQDRFFQMDLSRRFAAGELSELFGPGALEADQRQRRHRFRTRAERVVANLSPFDRRLARAYADGVNAGRESLETVPFEYLVLEAEPRPWSLTDTVLVVYSMYLDLNDADGQYEAARGAIEDLLGAEMLDFLDPLGTEWDAPVIGEPFTVPPVPGPKVFDLRAGSPKGAASARTEASGQARREVFETEPDRPVRGSNNWAVAGSLTADGRALLANDMHLGLRVPNIWYRAVLSFPDDSAPGGTRRVAGVTLPGAPFVIAGSNGEVAWGFTNTWGDWEDWVILESDPADPNWYLVPGGSRPFARFREEIQVKGGKSETLEVRETVWGPVLDRDHAGRERAYRWIAHDPQSITFRMLDLEQASTVEDALETAARIGAPPQNFVVADAAGRIGWTVMGPIPRRFGHTGRTPRAWHDGSAGWDGYLAPEEYPRIVDPGQGLLWTANSRVVSGAMLEPIGTGFRLGARAGQIRDRLRALEEPDERALLAVQLDDRAFFLERWRALLLEVLAADRNGDDSTRRDLAALVEDWGGHASIDSVGYRMVRAFRSFLLDQVYDAILARCKKAEARCEARYLNQLEGSLWRLVEERPMNFLSPEFASWDEQFQAAVDELLGYFAKQDGPLAEQTWGKRNTATIRHPLSFFLPAFLARRLNMPNDPLPGDSDMPRVQGPGFGASERFVVSPGHEEDGIFHMPTGQSGHPLSPFYRAGHEAWVRGEPTPFLPGETVYRLQLIPAEAGGG
jgi:penicillin amidase